MKRHWNIRSSSNKGISKYSYKCQETRIRSKGIFAEMNVATNHDTNAQQVMLYKDTRRHSPRLLGLGVIQNPKRQGQISRTQN